ncbi:MAG: hypothetical protein LBU07_06895 [Coriobacteriales bacterium]|jgi:hypothetical protein|nr:hypothetical protein [Coriobacteriales bacterium]
MNDLLAEIYSTIIPSAPYLIAAYALLLLIFFGYAFSIMRNLKKAETRLAFLEQTLAERPLLDKMPADRPPLDNIPADESRQANGG